MKKSFWMIPLSLALACTADRETGQTSLTIQNPTDTQRPDELVVLTRNELESRLGEFGDSLTVLVYDNETPVPSQVDDLDKDGQWDELAFVYNLSPNQEVSLTLRTAPQSEQQNFEKRTNVRLGKILVKGARYEELDSAVRLKGWLTDTTQKYFQFEGPGWENDKVGFRNYFDERNGMDIWGKRTSGMVLDEVGINDNYHELAPWGMDILKVANSLGAGALAVQHNDSLYRVTAPEDAAFELIAEGPVRSIFNLNFDKIGLNGDTIGLTHQISIVAGEYGYRSAVTLDNAPSGLSLVTGIVNLQSDTAYNVETEKAHILYTHDEQSYNNETLGMGVAVKKDRFKESFATPEEGEGITQTYAISFDDGDGIDYIFYAGWVLSDSAFAERDNFERYLVDQANRFTNPVGVKFSE